MICCAFIAMMIATPLWLARRMLPVFSSGSDNPVEWRLHENGNVGQRDCANNFSIRARFKSFVYALSGLRMMVRDEHNARIHLAATIGVVAVAVFLQISAPDWRWIVVAIGWVWIAEAINTALEHLCDVVCIEHHEGIRVCKDVAAGAVLVSAAGATVIGILTLYPYVAMI